MNILYKEILDDDVDITAFIEENDFDDEDALIFLNIFNDSYKSFNEEIKAYDIESEELKRAIHKLKGSSGNLKANEISSLCKDFEKAETFEKEIILEEIKIKLDSLIKKITSLSNKPKKIEESSEKLKDVLQRLIKDLKSYMFIDFQRVEDITNMLDYHLENKKLLDDINQNYQEGDFEKLEEILEKTYDELYKKS